MYKKLNLSYLSDTDKMMVECGFTTMILTSTLMDATVGNRLKLTKDQLQLLASDISMAKSLGLWEAHKEEQTIEQCYRRYERLEHIKRLSPLDRERYFQRVSEDLFNI